MSIPRLKSPLAFANEEVGEDTALIARLAGAFYSGRALRAPELPLTAPVTVAGVPADLSVPADITGQPAAENVRDAGLNGGFPTVSSSAPVHPTVVEQEVAPEAAPEVPAGGDVARAFEFGEPDCYGHFFANPYRQASWAGIERISEEPDFYFLEQIRGARVPVHPAPWSSFDVERVRQDFPALHQRVNGHPLIYLDNAATTHKPQAVLDATNQFYGRDNSNIHRAAHALAERSTQLFEASREKVRQFLGAEDAKEIVFLRGTTEAINLVANSYGGANVGPGDEILLTRLEHHANIVPWQLLAERTGAVIRVAPINDRGELIFEEFAKLLNPRTKIVSVTHVSNALGTVNPVEQIIPLAHAVGAVVLIDGAQSTPHMPVNVSALGADFYVFSAHKIFGPTGIGALYGKKHLLDSMRPWQGGGHMIQDVTFEKTIYRAAPEKFEAGTPDIAGVVGLGAAIDYLFRIGIPALAAYEHALLEYATRALSEVPGLKPIGTAANKASVLSFIIPGISNEKIARHLDKRGIAVRAGHHCALPAQRHFGQDTTVRPSLAFYNTFAEVDALVSALQQLSRSA